MQQLGKVLTQTTWAHASDTINRNNDRIYEALLQVEKATSNHKGYFISYEYLLEAYPNPQAGWTAFIYDQDNAQSHPYDIYQTYYDDETSAWVWRDSSNDAPLPEVDIDSINAEIARIDTKDSLQDEQIGRLQNPVKPLMITENGNIALAYGTGLYLQDNKLCASSSSAGGDGGDVIYSAGSGIDISSANSISVVSDRDKGIMITNEGVGIRLATDIDGNDISGMQFQDRDGALQVKVGSGLRVDADGIRIPFATSEGYNISGLETTPEGDVQVNPIRLATILADGDSIDGSNGIMSVNYNNVASKLAGEYLTATDGQLRINDEFIEAVVNLEDKVIVQGTSIINLQSSLNNKADATEVAKKQDKLTAYTETKRNNAVVAAEISVSQESNASSVKVAPGGVTLNGIVTVGEIENLEEEINGKLDKLVSYSEVVDEYGIATSAAIFVNGDTSSARMDIRPSETSTILGSPNANQYALQTITPASVAILVQNGADNFNNIYADQGQIALIHQGANLSEIYLDDSGVSIPDCTVRIGGIANVEAAITSKADATIVTNLQGTVTSHTSQLDSHNAEIGELQTALMGKMDTVYWGDTLETTTDDYVNVKVDSLTISTNENGLCVAPSIVNDILAHGTSIANLQNSLNNKIEATNVEDIVEEPDIVVGVLYEAGEGIRLSNGYINARCASPIAIDDYGYIGLRYGSGLRVDGSNGIMSVQYEAVATSLAGEYLTATDGQLRISDEFIEAVVNLETAVAKKADATEVAKKQDKLTAYTEQLDASDNATNATISVLSPDDVPTEERLVSTISAALEDGISLYHRSGSSVNYMYITGDSASIQLHNENKTVVGTQREYIEGQSRHHTTEYYTIGCGGTDPSAPTATFDMTPDLVALQISDNEAVYIYENHVDLCGTVSIVSESGTIPDVVSAINSKADATEVAKKQDKLTAYTEQLDASDNATNATISVLSPDDVSTEERRVSTISAELEGGISLYHRSGTSVNYMYITGDSASIQLHNENKTVVGTQREYIEGQSRHHATEYYTIGCGGTDPSAPTATFDMTPDLVALQISDNEAVYIYENHVDLYGTVGISSSSGYISDVVSEINSKVEAADVADIVDDADVVVGVQYEAGNGIRISDGQINVRPAGSLAIDGNGALKVNPSNTASVISGASVDGAITSGAGLAIMSDGGLGLKLGTGLHINEEGVLYVAL